MQKPDLQYEGLLRTQFRKGNAYSDIKKHLEWSKEEVDNVWNAYSRMN